MTSIALGGCSASCTVVITRALARNSTTTMMIGMMVQASLDLIAAVHLRRLAAIIVRPLVGT